MINKRFKPHGPTWLQVITLALLTCAAPSGRADLHLPLLKSGTVTYSNVTVYSQTDQDLYISHAQGLGNIKISTLDDEALRALGLKDAETESASATITAKAKTVSHTLNQLKTSLSTANQGTVAEMFTKLKETSGITITPQILWGTVAAVAVLYLFVCYCFKLICHNAGAAAGVVIWLPVLQMFPLLRAAKMSGWCFFLFLIPLVNVVMQIWWSFRIAKACGKGPLVGILLILPVTNLFAFLYLAFSKGEGEDQTLSVEKPMRFDGLANA